MPDGDVLTPISIPLLDAARRLSLSRWTVSDMIDRGVFTELAPHGRGRGKPLFLLVAEVEVYDRTRSEDAVRAYRAKAAADVTPPELGGEAGGA